MLYAPKPESVTGSAEPLTLRAANTHMLSCFALGALHGAEKKPDDLSPGETVHAFMNVEGRTHALRITEASDTTGGVSQPDIYMLPGFSEMTDMGSAKRFHTAVARQLPGSRVISIATEGVGAVSKPLLPASAARMSFNRMALDRLRIMQALSEDNPVTLLTVSMGSVIGLRLAHKNLQLPADRQIDIRHIVNHSHAQVPLDRVHPDLTVRFPLHVVDELRREGGRIPGVVIAHALGAAAFWPKQAVSHLRNMINFVPGTPEALTHTIAKQYPTTYLSGTRDPLAQPALLARLERAYPQHVNVKWLQGLGHLATAFAEREARTVAEAIRLRQA